MSNLIMDDRCSGVYAIINMKDGKSTTYIGSTINSCRHRWSCHKSKLRYNQHPNIYLQRAWNKYGEEAFLFVLLEEIKDYPKLLEHEQVWLDFHRMHLPVYNVSFLVGVNPMLGKEFSEEHRRKISIAATGRTGFKHSEQTKKMFSKMRRGKPPREKFVEDMVRIHEKPYPSFYNEKTGETIPAGINLNKMCEEHGLNKGLMNNIKNGHRRSHKGWILAVGAPRDGRYRSGRCKSCGI